jgi:protein KRI1
VFDDTEWGNEDEDWDEWRGEDEDEGPHVDDPDFNMDADFDPSLTPQSQDEPTSSKKHRKVSRFAQALRRKKPSFDPDESNFEEYFDEYYQLDYEDIVADQPCRFKYRKVIPNDFGLSTEEMLACNKGELNRWAPLRKIVGYRTQEEEARDVRKYKRKGKKHKRKLQLLPSIEKSALNSPRPRMSSYSCGYRLENEEVGESSKKEARGRNARREQNKAKKKSKSSAREEKREVGVASKISDSRLKSYGIKNKNSSRKTKQRL